MRSLLLLLPLFVFAACGGHALDGHWNQATADGKPGMTLEFDTEGTECMAHTAPDADGHHDHSKNGRYTFDEATGGVTITMTLPGAGAVEWKGKLVDGKLDLSSADGKLEFAKGHAAH